jgi:eukaryotic-like serine/threonine-protein kinase
MNRALITSGTAASVSTPERPVRRVGKYRILSELGRGGMANVYLAVAHGQGGVDKLVVLKALLPELSTDADALAMFLDEARLAARLNHANVVQTYEVGVEGDRQVIVMEYLDGQSLSSVVKQTDLAGRALSVAMYLRIIINALEGLHYAHDLCDYDGSSLGFVHRDVSPQNIFVTYDGQVKVLDFGIAKATTSSIHTATGVVKGKIAYMAPEQMIGEAIDRRADVYSVGCMLWMVATGKKLWKDTPDVQVMRRVINNEIPTPQSVNPSCDNELNRIVMKALASDANERYSTALELQLDLETYSESFSSPIKQREIGRYLSNLFADTRAELKGLVDRQLALVTTEYSSDDISRSAVRGSRAMSLEDGGEAALAPAATGGRRWLVVALLLLGIAALALVGRYALQPAPPPFAVAQLPSLPPAQAVPAPAQVPPQAQADAKTPPPAASDGSDDAAVKSAAHSGSQRFGGSLLRRPVVVERSNPAPTGKPACSQPFIIGPDGIKKFRPECM